MTYPHTPGYQSGSSTSQAAAESIAPTAGSKRARVLSEMRLVPLCGMTIDEAAVLLDCQTGGASARMRELELGGEIVKSTATRKTRFGRPDSESKRRFIIYKRLGNSLLSCYSLH